MPSARDMTIALVSAREAKRCVEAWHYSGKVVNNSLVHFGVHFGGRLCGVLSYGSPMDKRKVLGLVSGTPWDGMLELNRMALGPACPRNSESRSLAVTARMLRAQYPRLEWLLSFADGTQCGDGTIYRAAGWLLTGIKRNNQVLVTPSGDIWTRMSISEAGASTRSRALASIGQATPQVIASASMQPFLNAGWKPMDGNMMRYIMPLRPGVRERLTCPVLDYADIDRTGARMYRGKRLVSIVDAPPDQGGEAGLAEHGAPTVDTFKRTTP